MYISFHRSDNLFVHCFSYFSSFYKVKRNPAKLK